MRVLEEILEAVKCKAGAEVQMLGRLCLSAFFCLLSFIPHFHEEFYRALNTSFMACHNGDLRPQA